MQPMAQPAAPAAGAPMTFDDALAAFLSSLSPAGAARGVPEPGRAQIAQAEAPAPAGEFSGAASPQSANGRQRPNLGPLETLAQIGAAAIADRGFPEMVAQNPRGWGNAPPSNGVTGEARSGNTTLGDLAAQAIGPSAGPIASGIERGARTVADTAINLTGIPMAAEAGENLAAAEATGDVVRGVGAIGQGLTAAIPYTRAGRAVFATAPRAVAAGGTAGAAGLYASEAHAQRRKAGQEPAPPAAAPSDDGLTPEQRTERDGLKRQIDAGQFASRAARSAAIERFREINSISNDYLQQKNRDRAGLEAEGKKREAEETARTKRQNTPVKELLTDFMPYVPIAAGAVAGGVGARVKGGYVEQFNERLSGVSTRWKSAVDEAQAALQSGDVALARQKAIEAERFASAFKEIADKGAGGTGQAVAAGIGVGEFSQALPLAVDYARSSPGSDLYNETMGALTDLPGLAGRVMNGAALGGIPAKITSSVAGRNVKVPAGYGPETEGLRRRTSGGFEREIGETSLSELAASAAKRDITGASKSQSVVVRSKAGYHGANGQFVARPEGAPPIKRGPRKKSDEGDQD